MSMNMNIDSTNSYPVADIEIPLGKKRAHHHIVSYEEQSEAKHTRSVEFKDEREETDELEDLINTNIELRRQVRILKAIPDLVMVFDLRSQKLGFISPSVSEFLGTSAYDIEGTSFWECVTENSKALIQVAITNALACESEEDGSWLLANGTSMMVYFFSKDHHGRQVTRLVSMKGTIYMNEGTPECVCSIRPVIETDHLKHVISSSSLSSGVEH